MGRWWRAPWRPGCSPQSARPWPRSRRRPRRPAMPASSDPPAGETAALPAGVALHARPAAELVRAAGRLAAMVTIEANGRRANATSILQMLGLGAVGGTELTIRATGPDAEEAARALAEVI